MTELLLAAITTRRGWAKSDPCALLVAEYTERAARYMPCRTAVFASEPALLAEAARQPGRAAASLILFDSRGEALSSDAFAALLGRLRDAGTQRIVLGIGPADGWSKAALASASRVVSLGPMTLPHELARVVAAEQIYRALTILAGHPYHCGH